MRLKALIPGLVVLGLCACSGSAARNSTSSNTGSPPSASTGASSPSTSATPSQPLSTTVSAPSTVPDFVGRAYEDVSNELAGYGIPVIQEREITTQETGTVVRQDPMAGSSFGHSVTLWVDVEPSPVPDVVGKTAAEATEELRKGGFLVTQRGKLAADKADGTVVGQDPPAGTTNAAEVTIDVARKPEQQFLAEKPPLESDNPHCEMTTGAMEGDGELYAHAIGLSCRRDYADSMKVEYDLSRDFQKLFSKLALSNDSAQDARAEIEIVGDGRQLANAEVRFGETRDIDANLTEVLRLEVRLAFSGGSSTLILGDATLEGIPEQESTASSTG